VPFSLQLPDHLGSDTQGILQLLVTRRLPWQELASCQPERLSGQDAQDIEVTIRPTEQER
jgi:hypothetical protein